MALVWVFVLLSIAAGLLACSGLIIGKKPEAKPLLDKLVPYQAIIGVALLADCVWFLLRIGPGNLFAGLSARPVSAMAALGSIFGGIILGLIFGMPMISKATGKDGSAVVAKLQPFQVIVGLVVLGAGALNLLDLLGIHI